MPSSIHLSLPEAPRSRPRIGFLQILTFLGVAAILALAVVRDRAGSGAHTKRAADEATRLRTLAEDLEKRLLHAEADQVWGEYLAVADVSPTERADIVYRRGLCLKQAGRYAEAARRLTEVETMPLSSERMRKAHQLLIECLSALGKQDVRDLLSRQFALGSAGTEGETVLARVADIEITKEDLREEIVDGAVNLLAHQGAPLPAAEVRKQAEAMADKALADAKSLQDALSQVIRRKLLYLDGLRRQFGDDAKTLRDLSRMREEYIAGRALEAEVAKAMEALGPTEVSNHYEAHKSDWVEAPSADFSFDSFTTEDEAKAAIEKLRAGDAAAKDALRKADGRASEGEPLPGIGTSAEATAQILALGEGEVGDRPVEIGGKFHVFRVDAKHPARQLALAEAEPRVRADLARRKREEALGALGETLQKDFAVQILAGVEEPSPGAKAPPPGEGPAERPAGTGTPDAKDAKTEPAEPAGEDPSGSGT